jgi:DNA-binding response OmpR family regulator
MGGTSRGSILIVDDDLAVRVTVQELLKRAGYEAIAAESGEEALEIAATRPFDVALIDLVMPEMNGIELMGELKKVDPNLVLIMLTARGTMESAIEALRMGAYDYLTKPCDDERLKQVVDEGIASRREELRQKKLVGQLAETLRELVHDDVPVPQTPAQEDEVLACGPLEITPSAYLVTLEGQPLDLTPMEFNILVVLARNMGQVMSGRELLMATQGVEYDEFEAREIVRYHIHGLRGKLGDHAEMIRTVRGVGYRLQPEQPT